MKHYFVTIDLQNSRITISQRPVRQTNSHISLTLEGGIPGCQGEVNGKIMDLFINTGSKLTYVNNALARTLTSVGVEKVFYPIIGEFKTELYKIPALIGGLDIKLKCGVPPVKDEKKMFPSGHPVVLGNQVFSNTRVCLAFPEKQMMFLR